MFTPKLHHDGRLITLDYTLAVHEIIEYDDEDSNTDDDAKKKRRFAIHDKHDDFYWLTEHYTDKCRRTSKVCNPTIHGYVLCCGSEVIVKLKDEAQGQQIVADVARLMAESDARIFFLNPDLTVSLEATKP